VTEIMRAAKKEVDVSQMNNLTGPLSRRVPHEDREGIEALFVAAADAWRKEDTQALMTLDDLPIYAGTDNAAGAYQDTACDGEVLRQILTSLMQAERKDLSRTERRTPHFLSDSMAMVLVETSVTRQRRRAWLLQVGHSCDQKRRGLAFQERRGSRPWEVTP
jgi:hypothetical protein